MNLKKEAGLFNLEKRKMKDVKGGNFCGCGCMYEGQPGGSTTVNNLSFNSLKNLHSPCDPGEQIWTS